jgi:hypothetical protein
MTRDKEYLKNFIRSRKRNYTKQKSEWYQTSRAALDNSILLQNKRNTNR